MTVFVNRTVLIGILIAIAALPAGAIATKFGNKQTMAIGAGTTTGLLLLLVLIPKNPAMIFTAIIGLIASFSLVINSAIPFVLLLVPSQTAGLGIGMYFGGFSGAMSLFGVLFPNLDAVSASTSAIMGAIAFISVAVCIAATFKRSPQIQESH